MNFPGFAVRPAIEIDDMVATFLNDDDWNARQAQLDDDGTPYKAYHVLYGVLADGRFSAIADFMSGADARHVLALLESSNG